jgi:glucosyl-3-phosphoglycerate synthase
VDADAAQWLALSTWYDPVWTVDELLRLKGSRTISVVVPALDNEATVGDVVAAVMPLIGTLLAECVVVDAGSADDTAAAARAAGATVVRCRDILPELQVRPGKGEALWRALAATSGDLLVFLDGDLIDPDPGDVPTLLGPLLTSELHLVKGFTTADSGRVTELLARPLLAALLPALSGVIQPLGGEYAVTRDLAESVPFAAGHGVEIGLLLDAYHRYGLDALAQVNLGLRKHPNHTLPQLGVMARQVLGAVLTRCGVSEAEDTLLTQFVQMDGAWLADEQELVLADRPPIRAVLAS